MYKSLTFIILMLLMVYTFSGCTENNNESAVNSTDEIKDITIETVSKPFEIRSYEEVFSGENCSPGKISQSFSISNTIKKSISTAKKASISGGVEIEIPTAVKLSIESEIEKSYQNVYDQVVGEVQSINKEIPPWNNIEITIKYEKRVYKSEAHFEKEGDVYSVPYKFILNAPMPKAVSTKFIRCSGKPDIIEISPNYQVLDVGDKIKLSAELIDSQGNTLDVSQFDWSSSKMNIATVTKIGSIVARSEGETKITASTEGVTGSSVIKVNNIVRRINIEPAGIKIRYGESLSLDAKIFGKNKAIFNKKIIWKSNNDRVISISQDGIALSRWIGRATITATCEGVSANSQITVIPPIITYPDNNITLIVPFGAGSSIDTASRILAGSLKENLNQQVNVINFPGINGWKRAYGSTPDGHTLLAYSNKSSSKGNMNLDDFEPIAFFVKNYGLLAPRNTPKDVIVVLENTLKDIVNSEAFQKKMNKYNQEPYFLGALKFRENLK